MPRERVVTVLAGIDLSWSGRNPTGICIITLEDGRSRLERLECIPGGGATSVAELLAGLGNDVIAAIDAPLLAEANRDAERSLARAFGKQGVYAYAARPDFLARHNIAEGPALGSLLIEAGWTLALDELPNPGRYASEVFPRAITVSLLGAERALDYKRGRLAERLAPMTRYRGLLRDFATEQLSCLLDDPQGTLTAPPPVSSGKELKHLEDRLDAVACVLAAHHAYQFGAEGFAFFGDPANGCIAVPLRR